MMRGFLLVALAAFSLPHLCFAQASTIPKACEAQDDVVGVTAPLPHVAPVLKPGATLNVLAIGSASMFGPEATLVPGSLTSQLVNGGAPTSIPPAQVLSIPPTETAFPQQMSRNLESSIPGLKVQVTVRGGRSLSAADQLQLLADSLAHGKYELVIWQTGTVEAVRNLPPSEFAQTLAEGASQAEKAGADLMLIDPQYSRFLQTNSNIEPYEQAFQQLGSMPGVLLFHRYELMRSWANSGQIDLERTPKSGRKQAVELMHACLGVHISQFIINAAHS